MTEGKCLKLNMSSKDYRPNPPPIMLGSLALFLVVLLLSPGKYHCLVIAVVRNRTALGSQSRATSISENKNRTAGRL